ncbi:putative M18 family aminopeptidase 1 [compost metagenome]
MSEVMNLFDKAKIHYQLGTLGKIEKGGGGTIAYILANKGVDVIDCGPGVLSMHAPFEVSSEADVYMTYKAYLAFFKGF